MTTLSTAQAGDRFVAYARADLTNVSCTALQNRLAQCDIDGAIAGGVLLDAYLPDSLSLTNTDLLSYPTTTAWPDASSYVRAAVTAGAGRVVNGLDKRGIYFIDPATALLILQGTTLLLPVGQPCQVTYTTVGGVLKQQISNAGLTFVVDTHSTYRNVPWFAQQGATAVLGLQVVGFGLLEDAAGINVSTYGASPTYLPTITGAPTDHAPIIVTDHKHDAAGNVVTSAKAGNTTLDAHIVAVMQSCYRGDPLIAEESWCASTASGLQTGISFTSVKITGFALKRVLGVARSTSGGLSVDIQNIPPYWTAITQPNSGGLTSYSLLKWQQQNCRVVDMWHRAVGINIKVRARSCRYAVYMQAGYNALGPASQDTGKYNQGTIDVGGERIITALHIEPNAYGHDLDVYLKGHFMDEYNLRGETGSVIEILTDGTVAGAIDKDTHNAAVVGADYSIDDKVGSGDVFDCIIAGTCTVAPVASGGNYDSGTKRFTDPGSTLVWVYRNGGFKPVGAQLFATIRYRGSVLEASGRVLLGNVNDGHLEHDTTGLHMQNWSQAKAHHADAALYNPSPTTILTHADAKVGASGNSKRVYDVANVQNLVVGKNRYYGQTIPVDGAGVPTGVFPTAIGGNLLDSFWWNKNCLAFSAGLAMGDDDGDESDG